MNVTILMLSMFFCRLIKSWKYINYIKKRKLYMFNQYDTEYKQCIVSSKKKQIFCDKEVKIFIEENEKYKNKELITISPGGFKGFYLLGVSTFIKENYDTEDLIYSGASAGAWTALFLSYKGEPLAFIYDFLDDNIKKNKINNRITIFYEIQTIVKI